MRAGAWAILLLVTIAVWLALAPPAAADDPAQTLTKLPKPFPAPEFTLKDDNGKTHRLSDYRGNVVVLNFWATWCPPCRYEMPSMERVHKLVKGEGIVLLAVNVGETEDQVFEFTGRYPVTFTLLLDTDGKVTRNYPVVGLPTTFIIDPRGQVTHRAIGGREWDDKKLLAELRKLRAPAALVPGGGLSAGPPTPSLRSLAVVRFFLESSAGRDADRAFRGEYGPHFNSPLPLLAFSLYMEATDREGTAR